jgi:hypothetical protein
VDRARAGVEQHAHQLVRGRPAHDRVVHHHHALAFQRFPDRGQLHADAQVTHALVGLDKGPVDVAALDQPLAERDARRFREAERGGVPLSGIGMTRSAPPGTGCSRASSRPMRWRAA